MPFFHPKFSTLQRYRYLFLSESGDLRCEIIPSRKQISSQVSQELKTPTNTPPPEQSCTGTVAEQQKRKLSGLHSQKFKANLCPIKILVQYSIDAPFSS